MRRVRPVLVGNVEDVADNQENIEAKCTECHYIAHVDLRNAGLDHPYSATLVLERLRKTGGRVNPERVRQTSPQYQY